MTRPDAGTADEDLVRRAADGDREAFAVLFERYAPRVYRTVLRITGDAAEADDGTQEVFIRLHDQLHRFEGRSSFSTWIYRIAVNHALDRLRSRDRRPERLDGFDAPAADSATLPAEKGDLERAVTQALSGLSEKLRTALVLRYLEDLSYEEIADVLEVSVGTVKSRLSRAHEEAGPALEAVQRRVDRGEL